MTRFDFLDRYKLFIPLTHLCEFERDLYTVIHHEAFVERVLEEKPEVQLLEHFEQLNQIF